jgi:hypothetical protein
MLFKHFDFSKIPGRDAAEQKNSPDKK